MAIEWYYQAPDGSDQGPVNSSQLKRLADFGRVSPTTRLRRTTSEAWICAHEVDGLFDGPVASHPAPPPAAAQAPEERWYCSLDGFPVGPFAAVELAPLAQSGRLTAQTPLRHGEQGPWRPAGDCRELRLPLAPPAAAPVLAQAAAPVLAQAAAPLATLPANWAAQPQFAQQFVQPQYPQPMVAQAPPQPMYQPAPAPQPAMAPAVRRSAPVRRESPTLLYVGLGLGATVLVIGLIVGAAISMAPVPGEATEEAVAQNTSSPAQPDQPQGDRQNQTTRRRPPPVAASNDNDFAADPLPAPQYGLNNRRKEQSQRFRDFATQAGKMEWKPESVEETLARVKKSEEQLAAQFKLLPPAVGRELQGQFNQAKSDYQKKKISLQEYRGYLSGLQETVRNQLQ